MTSKMGWLGRLHQRVMWKYGPGRLATFLCWLNRTHRFRSTTRVTIYDNQLPAEVCLQCKKVRAAPPGKFLGEGP